MNAHHDMGYYTHACLKCGVTAEQLQNGASLWCDELEPTGHGFVAIIAHTIAIVVFIGAPLYAMMIPDAPTAAQVLFGCIIALVAAAIAEIHAGTWDWLTLDDAP